MISNKSAIWLFIAATVVLFGVLPQYSVWLISVSKNFSLLFDFLFIFWFITLNIVGWSYAVILYMADRHHWFTPVMIGIVYLLLTKEARLVAKDFYKFNFFKGDEK